MPVPAIGPAKSVKTMSSHADPLAVAATPAMVNLPAVVGKEIVKIMVATAQVTVTTMIAEAVAVGFVPETGAVRLATIQCSPLAIPAVVVRRNRIMQWTLLKPAPNPKFAPEIGRAPAATGTSLLETRRADAERESPLRKRLRCPKRRQLLLQRKIARRWNLLNA